MVLIKGEPPLKAKDGFYLYTVTGPGCFPSDMMRYDDARCYAVSTVGARCFHHIESRCTPTIQRWRSFLWVVIHTPEAREHFGIGEDVL